MILIIGTGLYINPQAHSSWSRIIIFQIISDIGFGLVFQGPLVTIFSFIKSTDIVSAAVTFFFVRDIATVMSIVLRWRLPKPHCRARKYDQSRSPFGTTMDGSAPSALDTIPTLPDDHKRMVASAYNENLRDKWIFYTAPTGVAIIPRRVHQQASAL